MITRSFMILDRISHAAEQNIWRSGITDWDSFIDAAKVPGISPRRKQYFGRRLNEAKKHLADYDSGYFASRMPASETWRLYDWFSDDCLFLDIETSGYYGDITVVGMYDGNDVMTLVKNRNLDRHILKEILSRYKLLVTFNGRSFDAPVINRCFNRIVPDIPHLDLRFPLAKLGFTGGLKKIEKQLGIRRNSRTDGMSGDAAVHLWHDYIATGDRDSLDVLVEYNTEDIVNLKPIAEFVFRGMRREVEKFFS